MNIETLTLVHVALSIVGISAGFLVIGGMLSTRRMPRMEALFLVTTILNSVTGYFFPIQSLTPAHIVGAISLVLLLVATAALYHFKLYGPWRTRYVVSAIAAQYLNVFVLVVQMFQKIPGLKALAPTQAEVPFAATQGLVLVLFIILGVAAVRSFRTA